MNQSRKADYANITRKYDDSFVPLCLPLTFDCSYYDLATGLYEEAWGQSFHFCRFAASEPFLQAIARHEHYLATKMNLKSQMKVLDVGCGVGGPAREIANFVDIHVTGLNINDYQIQRATLVAERAGMSDRLKFIKGDFMVSNLLHPLRILSWCLMQVSSNYHFRTIASTPSTPLRQPATRPASKACIPKSSVS